MSQENSYSIIINGKAVADYSDYEEALKASKGGFVIRTCDIEKYGYEAGYEEAGNESQ